LFLDGKSITELRDISVNFAAHGQQYRREGAHVWVLQRPFIDSHDGQMPSIYPNNSLPVEAMRLPHKDELILAMNKGEPIYSFVEANPLFQNNLFQMPCVSVAGYECKRVLTWEPGHIPPFKRLYGAMQTQAVISVIGVFEEVFQGFYSFFEKEDFDAQSMRQSTKSILDHTLESLNRLMVATGQRFFDATAVWSRSALDAERAYKEILNRTKISEILELNI
jgi:hypothetical protein